MNELLQSIRAGLSFAERLQNSELLAKFLDVQLKAQELVDENLIARQENQNLKDQIVELQDKLRFSETLEFIHGLYHSPDPDGRIGEPYCPTCWEAKRTAVHLHWQQPMRSYHCPNCNHQFDYTRRNPVLTRGHIDEGHATPNSKWNPDNKPFTS